MCHVSLTSLVVCLVLNIKMVYMVSYLLFFFFFFFQAEDGIRDKLVTGVQTCALPICVVRCRRPRGRGPERLRVPRHGERLPHRNGVPDWRRIVRRRDRLERRAQREIGRASCRERV